MKAVLQKYRPEWILIAIGILIFGHGILNQFVLFDDDLHIFRNPILGANGWEALKYFWSQPHKGLYIPVTYSFWLLQASILKFFHPGIATDQFSPVIFHITNVLFHLLNACLCFHVMKHWVKQVEVAFIAALVFLLHPVQVESVAWATGMKDLVAMSFALSSILAYFRAKASKTEWRWGWTALAGAFYLLSILSKPASLVLPVVLGGLEVLFLGEALLPTVFRLAPALVLAAPLALLTSQLQPLERNMYAVPLWGRPLVVADAFFFYLRKLIIPFPLVHDYGRLPHQIIYGWAGPVFLGALTIFSAVMIYLRKFGVLIFAGLFLAALGPVSGLVQFAFQNFSTVADHYLYCPILVPLTGAAFLLDRHWTEKAWKPAGIVLGIFALISFHQVGVWRDSTALFANTLTFNPKSILAHNNLAVQYEEAQDYKNSLAHYQISRDIAPHFAHHHYNVGNLLMKLDRLEEAKKEFFEALKLDPEHVDAHFNLGILAEADGNLSEAETRFSRALQNDPFSVKARVKLGDVYIRAGQGAQGERLFREALQFDPLSHQANLRMADYLRKTGRAQEATPYYRQVLATKPSHDRRNEILSYLK